MANYAIQYCQALSQQYPNVLHYGALFARNQEADYRWANAHTIEVPAIEVTGRVDGSRASLIERKQRHANKWTPIALRNHRAWNDFIHPRDIDETNQVLSIQNITQTMNVEQKFPEKDKYLISQLYADWNEVGRVPFTGKLTRDNILNYFDMMMTAQTERNVPLSGRILYITPQANVLLKGASEFYRHLNAQGTAPARVQRAIAQLDNVSIEEVPSDHMLTVYDFTVGAVRGASAKQITMFLVHPTAVITPEVYDFARLDPPSAGSQGKYEYFEESFEDAFILPNKQFGIEFLVTGLVSEAATFTSAAGTETGTTAITLTAPIGNNQKPNSRFFYAVATGTAVAAPTFGTSVIPDGINDGETAWMEWDGESDIVAATGSHLTLLVTDIDGRVYASSNNTVTAKT